MSRHISKSIRESVLDKQNNKCANKPGITIDRIGSYQCPQWTNNNGHFDESGYEFDHIIEHCLTKDNSVDNIQVLCVACHKVKTKNFAKSDDRKQLNMNNKNRKKLKTLTVKELKEILKNEGEKTGGKKDDLIERIISLNIPVSLYIGSSSSEGNVGSSESIAKSKKLLRKSKKVEKTEEETETEETEETEEDQEKIEKVTEEEYTEDSLMALTIPDLKEILRKQGKKISGKKKDLVERILS